MKTFHKIFLNQIVIYYLEIQSDTTGLDRWKKCICIAGQQHDDCIFRRLLNCLEKSILCLYCHHLRIRNNIDLVRTAVWFNCYIVNQLITNLIY